MVCSVSTSNNERHFDFMVSVMRNQSKFSALLNPKICFIEAIEDMQHNNNGNYSMIHL